MLLRIDLHVHTMESDGVLSVQEVIKSAEKNGVGILSITDHESTAGIQEAQRISSSLALRLIPGVELLTSFRGQEVHLLGYYKNIDQLELQKKLKELRERRTALAYDMVKLLQRDGIPLQWSDVEREANTEGTISKGHIMRALYHRDMLSGNLGWQEVGTFFQPGGIAYLPFLEHRFEDAVDMIYFTGGMPVLAHPGILHRPEIVPELLSYRPIGLEVYYGYWDKRQNLINYYAEIARGKASLATGGSDFHGPFSQIKIGQMDVPIEGVNTLQKYLGIL
ncbi:MAG: PHP domain-containing protein [Desulfitobacteriaceae bacterium]